MLNTTCNSDEARYTPNIMFTNCANLAIRGRGHVKLTVASCTALPISYERRLSPSFPTILVRVIPLHSDGNIIYLSVQLELKCMNFNHIRP